MKHGGWHVCAGLDKVPTIPLRSLRWDLAALLALMMPLCTWGQFRPVPGHEYREYQNPVNPVAGEAIVGLAIAPTEAALRASAVQVLLPAGYKGELRIETASADGRFRGEGLFAGATSSVEWATLPLTSADGGGEGKGAPARPLNPLALAIAARGANKAIFIVRWGDGSQVDSPERLRLYVNSRRGEMFVRAGAKLVRCVPVGVVQSVRFDSYCDLTLADIPKDGQLTLVRRDQFDEQTQAFKVQMP